MYKETISDILSGFWIILKVLTPIVLLFSTVLIHPLLPFVLVALLVLLFFSRELGKEMRRRKQYEADMKKLQEEAAGWFRDNPKEKR